jgi:CBS domain-containing protein
MNERQVKAQDLMRTAVLTLSPDDTIETALALFEDAGIGGAPVVANGKLAGMLTLTDVSRTEHFEDRSSERGEYALSDAADDEDAFDLDPAEVLYLKHGYSPEVLGRALVGDWMSRGVISVAPEASLQQVCSAMASNKIHRVCVVEGDRLVGLITSFDIVRHMAGEELHARMRPRAAHRRGTRTRSRKTSPERRS